MTSPAPAASTNRSTSHRGRGVGLVAAAAGSLLVTVAAVWWATRLGGETLAVLLALVLAGTGSAAVAIVGRRSSPMTRRSAIAVTLVGGTALAALAATGALVSIKLSGSIPVWTQEAERALAEADADPTTPCRAYPVDPPSLPDFGRVDQRCVFRSSTARSVVFHQMDPMGGWTGLLYSPDQSPPSVMSQCLAHLDGPWWQTASADPSCPNSRFTFVGGG